MKTTAETSRNSLVTFFIITFSFSWFFWFIDVLSSLKIITLPFSYMVFFIVGAHGPLVAALILSYRSGGWGAVKHLVKAGFNFRLPLIGWVVILIAPYIVSGLALAVNVQFNDFQFDKSLWSQPLMILPTFVMMFFVGGSVQEEFGWRGYALPRLLNRWNPLVASLILGAIWGIWHLPLFFIEGTGQFYMPIGIFLLLTEAFSIFLTWAYLRTGRNLFSSLLLHTSINTCLSIFPPIEKVTRASQSGMTYLLLAYATLAVVLVFLSRALFFRPAMDVHQAVPTT